MWWRPDRVAISSQQFVQRLGSTRSSSTTPRRSAPRAVRFAAEALPPRIAPSRMRSRLASDSILVLPQRLEDDVLQLRPGVRVLELLDRRLEDGQPLPERLDR